MSSSAVAAEFPPPSTQAGAAGSSYTPTLASVRLPPLRRDQPKPTFVAADHPRPGPSQSPRRNIGSSTFRFVLAALLAEELSLRPLPSLDRVLLSREDNRRLSQGSATTCAWPGRSASSRGITSGM